MKLFLRKYVAACAAFAVSMMFPLLGAAETVHSERSLYRNLFVTEDNGQRCLTFRKSRANTRQTCMSIDEPQHLVFPYTRMMMGSLYLNPNPARIAVIGLGGGTLPMRLRELLPDAVIDTVEIDAAVVKAAREYFGFKDDPRMTVHEEDGRVFVKKAMKAKTQYDLIMLDAFEDDYIPEHLLTKEFLEEVKSILAPGGVIAANTFSSSGLYPHESATYAAVFGTFYNLKSSNRVIWAQVGGVLPMSKLEENAKALEAPFEKMGIKARSLLSQVSTERDWPASTKVLTDQYSPSNILNAR